MVVGGGLEGQNKPWGQAPLPSAPASGQNMSLNLQLVQHLSVLLNSQAPTPRHKVGNMETQEHRHCLVTALLQQTPGNKDTGVRKE